MPHEGIQHRTARRLLYVEDRADRAGDEISIGERREVGEPHAVLEAIQHFRPDLQRAPRLADTSGTEQRDDAVAVHDRLDLRDVAIAPDEARHLLRQVVVGNVQRPQRRKVRSEAECGHLKHVFRRGEVLEPVHAHVAQLRAGRKRWGGRVGSRLREQYLLAVTDREQSGHAVQRRAEIVRVAFVRRADVQRDPHAHAADSAEVCCGQIARRSERRRHRILRSPEDGAKRVADRLEDNPIAAFDCAAHESVVMADGVAHPFGVAIPADRAPFDVGEHEEDRARRQGSLRRRSRDPARPLHTAMVARAHLPVQED